MRRRSDRQQINDHHLIESRKRMIDVPGPMRRPVPIERIALRRASVPVPFHRFPQPRDSLVKRFFSRVLLVQILPRSEQAFHQKRRLDQIAGVIKHVKNRKTRTGVIVHKM